MDFEEILKQLKVNLLELVNNDFTDFKDSGEEIVNTFLENSKDKLKRWTQLLVNEEIDLEEYEWLLKSQKDLFEMNALLAAGISKIKIGRFKNKAIKTIVDVMCKLIL